MSNPLIVENSITINAPASKVWDALVNPEQTKKYMFGCVTVSDWQVGSPITWKGEMNGRPYEDKGEVLEADEPRRLSVTHYSPLMGQEDRPENYHTVTYTLAADGDAGPTTVTLEQDGNTSQEQADQFGQNWQSMLDAFKATVESA